MGTTAEQQLLVSTFLDIAGGQSADTAIQFLLATSWNLEEAIQLFFIGNEGDRAPPSHHDDSLTATDASEEYVRAPLPARTETLYGEDYQDYFEESWEQPPVVWEPYQTSYNASCDNLASLYCPPYALMYNGPFEMAKVDASLQDKWLLVNLQSSKEFTSHMLNRDTWSNEAVAQTIHTSFIFWQVFHDTTEGKKVCSYYKLDSIPAILVIDPITGQKTHAWFSMVQPEHLLDDLIRFIDRGPKEHHVTIPHKYPIEKPSLKIPNKTSAEEEELLLAVATSMEAAKETAKSYAANSEPEPVKHAETSSSGKPSYPPLPEEPKTDRQLLCRVGIRLPDGRRVQRSFLRSDPIKFLWSFCCSLVEGDKRPFHFTQAIPGVSKKMDYESNLTFEEEALANSMISLAWD